MFMQITIQVFSPKHSLEKISDLVTRLFDYSTNREFEVTSKRRKDFLEMNEDQYVRDTTLLSSLEVGSWHFSICLHLLIT